MVGSGNMEKTSVALISNPNYKGNKMTFHSRIWIMHVVLNMCWVNIQIYEGIVKLFFKRRYLVHKSRCPWYMKDSRNYNNTLELSRVILKREKAWLLEGSSCFSEEIISFNVTETNVWKKMFKVLAIVFLEWRCYI